MIYLKNFSVGRGKWNLGISTRGGPAASYQFAGWTPQYMKVIFSCSASIIL